MKKNKRNKLAKVQSDPQVSSVDQPLTEMIDLSNTNFQGVEEGPQEVIDGEE